MTLAQKISSVNIVSAIQGMGVKLRSAGKNFTGICPLHGDSNPSLYVYPERKKFHCFGCGEHGDIVDFVQKLHGWDIQHALRHLGISTGPPSAEDKNAIKATRKKQDAERRYHRRETDLAYTLGTMIRWLEKALPAIKTTEDMETVADLLDALPWWEYCHGILITGDRENRRQVVDALDGLEIIQRGQLFTPGFDFKAWLRKFAQNGTPKKELRTGSIEILFA
jgi:hypothetical protein